MSQRLLRLERNLLAINMLISPKTKPYKLYVKIVAFTVITTFLCQNLVWANPFISKTETLASQSLIKLWEAKGKPAAEALDVQDRLFSLRSLILKGETDRETLINEDKRAGNLAFIDKLRFSYKVEKEEGYDDVYRMSANLYKDRNSDIQVILFYPENNIPWELLKGKYGVKTAEDEEYARRGFWISRRPPIDNVVLVNLAAPRYKEKIQEAMAVNTLAAYIRARELGINVSTIDMYSIMRDLQERRAYDFDALIKEVIEQIIRKKPMIVGLSAKWGTLEVMDRIIEELSRLGDERPLVVLGNVIPTFAHKEILGRYEKEYKYIIAVLGEGEEALEEISTRAKSAADSDFRDPQLYKDIPDVAVSSSDEPVRKFLDLEEYPFAGDIDGRELLEIKKWWDGQSIETSRGCPWGHCTFCSIRSLYGITEPVSKGNFCWRPFPLDKVLDRIRTYVDKGERQFYILDSEFIGPVKSDEDFQASMRRVEKFAEGILKINEELLSKGDVPIRIYNTNVRADALAWEDPDRQRRVIEVLRLMQKAGFVDLFLGIESGSEEQLRRYGKGVRVKQNEKAISILRELGFCYWVGFVFFDPLATVKVLKDNIDFIERTRLYRTTSHLFGALRLQAGSPYVKIVQDAGLLTGGMNLDDVSYQSDYKHSEVGEIKELFDRWERVTYEELFPYLRTQAAKIKDNKERQYIEELLLEIRTLDFRFMKEVVYAYDEHSKRGLLKVNPQLSKAVKRIIEQFTGERQNLFDKIEAALDQAEFTDESGRLKAEILPNAREKNRGFKAERKRDAFIETLEVTGAIEEIARRAAKHSDQDLLLHLDEEGRLQIKGTNKDAEIFDLDSENIAVGDDELELTCWDVLRSKLKGRKDTELEMIPEGLDLPDIRALLIHVLLRRELISKDQSLAEGNLKELEGITAALEQRKKISISSKHLVDNIIKLGENRFKYNQTSSGIKYILSRIQAGFNVEIINESEITDEELKSLISAIFDIGQYFITDKISVVNQENAIIADRYRNAVLLLHENSSDKLKTLKEQDVKILIGEKGASLNVLITVSIYKLLGRSEIEIRGLLINLGYTEEQVSQMDLKNLIVLPPVASVLYLINDIASFRRVIDLSA